MRRTAAPVRSWTVAVSGLAVGLSLALPAALVGPAEAGTPPDAAPRSAAAGGSLKVKVVQPARGKQAHVVVTGPQRFREELTRTTRLTGLAPGRYRVRAATVRTRTWYARPEVGPSKVRVRAGRTAHTEVSYWNTVARATKVVSAGQAVSYLAPSGTTPGQFTLDVRRDPGSILVAGVTPATPYGALVKVTGVQRTSAGWVHTVQAARLDEAVPRGDFDQHFTVGTSSVRAARGRPAPSFRLACSGTMDAGFDVHATADFGIAFSARWAWTKSSITLKATADGAVDAAAWANAAGTCSTGELTISSNRLATIAFSIGPIPVVILPTLDIAIGAEASASGKLRVDGHVDVAAAAGITASLGGVSFDRSGPTVTGSSSFDVHAQASAKAYGQARVTMELYGLAGPYAVAQFGARANADTKATPWWTVDGYATAGVGIRFEKCVNLWIKKVCVKLNAGKPDLLSGSFRLAAATEPYGLRDAVINNLVGTGVRATDARLGGVREAADSLIALRDRVSDWHMATGRAADLPGVPDQLASTAFDSPGYAPLTALLPNQQPTFDASTVEITVVPEANTLRIPYIFASEEWDQRTHHDVMGIFVDGTNCATDANGGPITPAATTRQNTGAFPTRYNRLTDELACVVRVVPGRPVQVVLAVADTDDAGGDSALSIPGRLTSYAS